MPEYIPYFPLFKSSMRFSRGSGPVQPVSSVPFCIFSPAQITEKVKKSACYFIKAKYSIGLNWIVLEFLPHREHLDHELSDR